MQDDEPYLWDYLAYHLIEGARDSELVETLKDWRYLARKIWLRKSLSVEDDLVKIPNADDVIQTLRRSFANSGHIFNRCTRFDTKTSDDIKVTLFVRLRHLSELKPIMDKLVQNLSAPYIALKFDLPDLPHPALIRTLVGHSSGVKSCGVSPDGQLIVSASDDGEVLVWEAESGKIIRVRKGHLASVNGCIFCPNGDLMIAPIEDKEVRIGEVEVLDARSGEIKSTLKGHRASVNGCVFSPNGDLIASASDDRTIKVWGPSGNLLRTFEGHSAPVNGCVFSPNGKRIVSASDDGTLKVWDTELSDALPTPTGHLDVVRGCSISADGNLIASASFDHTIKVWDANTGRVMHSLIGHRDSVNSCAFNPSGEVLVSASSDATLAVWSVTSGAQMFTLETVTIKDGVSSQKADKPKGHSDAVNDCCFSPDGKSIVSASSDHTLKLWGMPEPTLLGTLERRESWDKATETNQIVEGHLGAVNACAFSPNGNWILSASSDYTLIVWDTTSRAHLRSLRDHSKPVNACAFRPDGKGIVSASSDGTLKTWESDSGTVLRTLRGHSDIVNGCCLSPDGELIVSASDDKTLKVWGVHSGRCLTTFYADGKMYCCATDGDMLVAGGERGVYFLRLVR